MQPRNVPKRSDTTPGANYHRCIIVCAYTEDGITLEQGYRVRDRLNSLDTDGWWFMNPGLFVVAFRSDQDGARERAQSCMAALGALRSEDSSLSSWGVGSAEGKVLCALAPEGYLDTPPLGEIVNDACRAAVRNAR